MKRIFHILLLCTLYTLPLANTWAQEELIGGVEVFIKRGDEFLANHQYDKAVKYYQKALHHDKKNNEVKLKIAETYKVWGKDPEAAKWFEKVIDDTKIINSTHHLQYADALMTTGNYKEAEKWYRVYNKEKDGDDYAKNMIFSIQNMAHFYRDTLKYTVSHVNFNSSSYDFCPTFYGDSLVFVSNKGKGSADEKSLFNLYKVAIRDTTKHQKPILFWERDGKKYHDGSAVFTEDLLQVFFTRTIFGKDEAGNSTRRNKVFHSVRKDTTLEWSKPKILKLGSEKSIVISPTISSDGKLMIFASNEENGIGKFDLYMSKYVDSVWSDPINLGKRINTIANDLYPYLHNDSTLYFASKGHPGMGGYDIYKTKLYGNEADKVVNLGFPFNTQEDDFGLIITHDEQIGFFNSSRDGGKGKDDIYRFDLKKIKTIVLEGFTKDIEHLPINMGNVLLYDNVTKETLGRSDTNGFFVVELDSGKNYNLVAKALSKPKYFDIHFEGFVKNRKDTNQTVSLRIIDHITYEEIVGNIEDGYMKFNLEEGREYEMKIELKDTSHSVSDIHFEGFVMDKAFPHISLGEVLIFDASNDERLFKSDAAGYFNINIEKSKNYIIKAIRKSPEDFFELSFEGFIKNKKDSSHVADLIIVDPETGRPVYKSSEDGYSKFIVENGKHYSFMSKQRDTTGNVDASDLHFEGFVKDVALPIIVGEVKVVDEVTKKPLFVSDENGFFQFKMEDGKYYDLVIKKRNPVKEFRIEFQGFMKVRQDSISKSFLKIKNSETGQPLIFKEDNNGYFLFDLVEGVPYNVMGLIDGQLDDLLDTNKSTIAKTLKFQGFVKEKETLINAGKVQVFEANSDTVIFESDDFGYFHFGLEPDKKLKFYTRKSNHGDTSFHEKVTIVFDGFIKDENDSLTLAELKLYDPSTGKIIMQTGDDGYFKLELEENKVYEVLAKPKVIAKHVLSNVKLIVIEENARLHQYLLEEVETGKLYELHLQEGKQYYTDGMIKRSFDNKLERSYDKINEVLNLLEAEKINVLDSIVIRSIYYKTNSAKLNSFDIVELNKVIDLLNQYPKMKLVISSYADSRGSEKDNKALTDKRNRSVLDYLKKKGINTDDYNRVESISYGEFKSLNDCTECLESDHDKNRRTDLHIISY